MSKKIEIRQRDKNLKHKWKGINDKVPVNYQLYLKVKKERMLFL